MKRQIKAAEKFTPTVEKKQKVEKKQEKPKKKGNTVKTKYKKPRKVINVDPEEEEAQEERGDKTEIVRAPKPLQKKCALTVDPDELASDEILAGFEK